MIFLFPLTLLLWFRGHGSVGPAPPAINSQQGVIGLKPRLDGRTGLRPRLDGKVAIQGRQEGKTGAT